MRPMESVAFVNSLGVRWACADLYAVALLNRLCSAFLTVSVMHRDAVAAFVDSSGRCVKVIPEAVSVVMSGVHSA